MMYLIKRIKVLLCGEMFFVLFLVSGYFKAGLQLPIDLTIFFLALSFLVFIKRFIQSPKVSKSAFVPLVLFSCLVGVLLGSMFWTNSLVYSIDKTLRFMFITGWAFLGGLLLINNKESVKRFLLSMVLVSTAGSLMTIYLFMTNSSPTGFIALSGDNYLGAARLSGLGATLLIINYFYGENKLLSLISLFINVFALMATGARMPLIAFFVIFLLMTFSSVRYKKGTIFYSKNTKYVFLLAFLIFSVGSFILESGGFKTTISRLEVLFTEQNGGSSANARIERYYTAMEMFNHNVVLGDGIGSFPLSFSSIDKRDYPHNIFLELLSELGLIGFLLFLALLLTSIYRITINYGGTESKNMNIQFTVLVGILFTLLNALVSGDINDNRMLFTFLAVASIAPICRNQGRLQKE